MVMVLLSATAFNFLEYNADCTCNCVAACLSGTQLRTYISFLNIYLVFLLSDFISSWHYKALLVITLSIKVVNKSVYFILNFYGHGIAPFPVILIYFLTYKKTFKLKYFDAVFFSCYSNFLLGIQPKIFYHCNFSENSFEF